MSPAPETPLKLSEQCLRRRRHHWSFPSSVSSAGGTVRGGARLGAASPAQETFSEEVSSSSITNVGNTVVGRGWSPSSSTVAKHHTARTRCYDPPAPGGWVRAAPPVPEAPLEGDIWSKRHLLRRSCNLRAYCKMTFGSKSFTEQRLHPRRRH